MEHSTCVTKEKMFLSLEISGYHKLSSWQNFVMIIYIKQYIKELVCMLCYWNLSKLKLASAWNFEKIITRQKEKKF